MLLLFRDVSVYVLWNSGGGKRHQKSVLCTLTIFTKVCVLMKGNATGDMPNKLFCERSRRKSITHFQNLLTSDDTIHARASDLM